MWPWEHAAVGYLLVSVLYRFLGRADDSHIGTTPSDAVAVAVLLGTQFPDLVDKPLAWWVAVLSSGNSLAHSLPVALPACLLAVALTRWVGRPAVGVAFAVGYLSHLLGDAVYPALLGGEVAVGFLLAPSVGVGTVSGTPPGLFATAAVFWGQFTAFLGTPRGTVYLGGEVALLGVSWLAWWVDGRPGLARPRAALRAVSPR